MRKLVVVAILSVCIAGPVRGQAPIEASDHVTERPIIYAERVSSPIRLDGRLDEDEWRRAPVLDAFTQLDPEEGDPVSQRTEARILYDDEALYIGMRLFDDGAITARLGRRDMPLSDSDWAGVVIDSYHDHRTGFTFDVNPAGVQRDAIKSVGTTGNESDDNSWDAVWDVSTSVDEAGWTAEYRIPFSQLRFGPADRHTWGIQLERMIGRRKEYAVSTFTPKAERGGIATYGHVVGIGDIEPGSRLEVLPYVVSRAEYVDQSANPFRSDSEYYGSGGVDLLYRVSSDFTLNASLNPDFGQVEVDPAVINLSVYETFFEEKRPFFIEGSEIFGFGRNTSGGQLFYSRRIGRRPQVAAPSRQADLPDATTILGAGKLSGKTASGWSLGVMEAVTAEESAAYMDPLGVPGEAVVEPLTNYLVARARRDGRAGQSSVGGMFTAVNRDVSSERVQLSLRESAYAGGVDFRHEWDDRAWVLQGSFAGSRIAGSPEAIDRVQRAGTHFFQRPDAPHLDYDPAATALSGYSAGLSLGRQAGRHWRGSLAVAATSPTFEVNDLGYQYRTDRRDAALTLNYLETRPGTFLRDYSLTGNFRFEQNYSNERINARWNLSATFRTLDFWGGAIYFGRSEQAYDDRLTRGGPLAERPRAWFTGTHLNSDPRKDVTVGLNASYRRDAYGGWTTAFSVPIGIKASSRWSLTVGPGVNKALNLAQYLTTVPDAAATATYGSHYVFAPLRQTTVSMVTRLDLTFTPKLSFQLFAQPFISSGDYGDPVELEKARTYQFRDWEGEVPNLDFNFRSLRGTAVLRWEWRPGSTLYFAWQQVRSDYALGVGDFDFARDRRALFSAPADDIFVIKLNYWLTP